MNDELKSTTSAGKVDQQEPPDALARAVHWTLLLGLVASALMMIFGLIVAIAKNEPRPEALTTDVSQLFHMAAQGSGVAWMELGIFGLMFTPCSRVIVLAVGWAFERDWRMAAIALVVLTLLAISLTLGVG
jgi:uncharacterized membrane protein